MKQVKKIKKENKLFRREYRPVFFAFFVLVILVIGLIYFINNKPAEIPEIDEKNSLSTIEYKVGSSSDFCEDYDIDALRKEANEVFLTYGLEKDVVIGQAENPDAVPGEDDYGGYDVYDDVLKVFINGITDNLKVKVIYHNRSKDDPDYDYELDAGADYTSFDIDEEGNLAFYSPNQYVLTYITIRIYTSDPICNDLLLREFDTVLPRKNSFAYDEMCLDSFYKDFDMCQMFVFDTIDYENSYEIIENMKNEHERELEKEKNEKSNKKNIINIRWLYIFGVIIIVIILIVVIAKKGSNNHGKKNN